MVLELSYPSAVDLHPRGYPCKSVLLRPISMKTKSFQLRWNEPLGVPGCPYMRRWVLICFGWSIRVHRWYRSDDKRFYHNHPWNFVTFVLRGSYTDVSPGKVEPVKEVMKAGTFKYRSATHAHYVDVPAGGALTLLLTGPPIQKWGFLIKAGQTFRPLRYFSRYGHPPCSEQ